MTTIADGDLTTKFSNQGGVSNTRHNLTQRPPTHPKAPLPRSSRTSPAMITEKSASIATPRTEPTPPPRRRCGTDLSNDHPIGVPYRGLTASTDYAGGTTTSGNLLFFDRDGDSRADKDEVRFYNTGGGFEVECAPCHDPHGVPSAGAGSPFIGTFLRIANAESALCLTCHTK